MKLKDRVYSSSSLSGLNSSVGMPKIIRRNQIQKTRGTVGNHQSDSTDRLYNNSMSMQAQDPRHQPNVASNPQIPIAMNNIKVIPQRQHRRQSAAVHQSAAARQVYANPA